MLQSELSSSGNGRSCFKPTSCCSQWQEYQRKKRRKMKENRLRMAMAMRCFFRYREMTAWPLFLLVLTLAADLVQGQTAGDLSFISIDCGYSDNSYTDPVTGITYVPDSQYTDTGVNRDIAVVYATNVVQKAHHNLRSFPNGTRNCYTITSITPGLKYLIRASFLYGNYDGLSKQFAFDLYLGVNLWRTISISDPSVAYVTEVFVAAQADVLFVCLVNTGNGTPFISELELRPMSNNLYPAVNSTNTLVLFRRYNMGPIGDALIRYPDDPHDRIWEPYTTAPSWTVVTTNATISNIPFDQFEAPAAVMRTAVIPASSTKLQFSWTPAPAMPNLYFSVLHFTEFISTGVNQTRLFYVYMNGALFYSIPFDAGYLTTAAIYSIAPFGGQKRYNFSLEALSNATLPPFINAMEFYSMMSSVNTPTDSGDVDAILSIKNWYDINRNWMGDPCSPKEYAWEGLKCTSFVSNATRITTLNLSSSGLTGTITTYFASLNMIEFLDLSHNNLVGPIPAILGQLPSLKLLDLTNNQLNGSIPFDLQTKSQNKLLTLRIEGNPSLCANAKSCLQKSSKKIVTPVVILLCLIPVLVLAGLLAVLYKRNQPQIFLDALRSSFRPRNEFYIKQEKYHQYSPRKNRQFTYLELKEITNNFGRILGKGGFGIVFHGYLENGTEVAVKMRSESSPQGSNDFLSEAQHLSRIHHKNLVNLIGYCKDEEHAALVFEFMSEGNLQDHLKGKNSARDLNWKERLKIALDSAQGLEYLHIGCKKQLIHRDVKTANILLSERFEAKIADFGISKVLQNDMHTHVSTRVVGTQGYLDPEYYTTHRLSDKSDVYSFGVVLLELITGKPPILPAPENSHVRHWVSKRLSRGNIEHVADTRFQGEYNENSMWKCVEVALKCMAPSSHQRPAMSEVVKHLKESLELETSHDRTENMFSNTQTLYTPHSNTPHTSE